MIGIFSGEWDIHRSDVFWSIFLGTLAGWTGVYCVKQTQIQRYCCLNSKANARKYVKQIFMHKNAYKLNLN